MFRSEIKHGRKSTITTADVVDVLAKDDEVFEKIEGTVVTRSFPTRGGFTPQAKNVLCKILEEGFVPFDRSDETDPGLRVCYENGWIQRALRDVGSKETEYIAVLASRLHEK